MKTITRCLLGAAAGFALSLSVQFSSAGEAPKPGAEQKRFEYYIGRWTIESDVAASPFGPAGKNKGIQIVERGPGGFSMILRWDTKTPQGQVQALGVVSYDGQRKAYSYHGVDSLGTVGTGTGSIDGPKWTWATEDHVDGKAVKGRFTINELSPTSYTFKFEMLGDDGKFSTVEDGKATKTK